MGDVISKINVVFISQRIKIYLSKKKIITLFCVNMLLMILNVQSPNRTAKRETKLIIDQYPVIMQRYAEPLIILIKRNNLLI